MNRPLAIDRLDDIRRRIAANGSVTVAALAEAFGVSRETVRRDLKQLAGRGDIEIVHGGATRRRLAEPTVCERATSHGAAKALIARAAAGLVPERATIIIDAGSTALAVARELAQRQDLTVATNSLSAAILLARSGHTVHMLGGVIDANDEAALSAETAEALSKYHFDLAFIGSGGLSATAGLTDYSREAATLRSRLIVSVGRAFLLADASKFDLMTPYPVANAERLHAVVTEQRPRGALARWLTERRIKVIVAA